MDGFYKGSIIIIGIGAMAMGLVPLGAAVFALGVYLVVALRPVDDAFEQATEDENPAGQVSAMGWGCLVFVIAIAAFAFIVAGAMPGGALR